MFPESVDEFPLEGSTRVGVLDLVDLLLDRLDEPR